MKRIMWDEVGKSGGTHIPWKCIVHICFAVFSTELNRGRCALDIKLGLQINDTHAVF
jgi:hypothetical protein